MNRWKLIEKLGHYQVHTNIIEIIVQMYSQDVTTISLGNLQEKIEITRKFILSPNGSLNCRPN